MEIQVLYFAGCPNAEAAQARVLEAAAGLPDVTVVTQQVDSPEDAERAGMRGSPTILVDGVDLFAEPGTEMSWACRLYRDPHGTAAGVPSVDQLTQALTPR